MSFFAKHKLSVITTVYWFLALYIVAALWWWFIALNSQNRLVTTLRLQELKRDDPQYFARKQTITEAQKRKTAQYLGEGTTFFALIIVCAVYVYRSMRSYLRLSQQQQNFMMAVTHELKTPIAITRLNLETLLKRKLETEQQQKLIGHTLYETDRLNTLCNNILLAAQLDSGVYLSAKQQVNLSEVVNGSIKNFRLRFPGREILPVVVEEDIYLTGEELLLHLMVNNLIENALKYSPRTSAVKIELKIKNNRVVLQVADEGSGVADSEKKNIFKKFYRSGDENTRKTKGTGLGLYLCKKIMESHKGTICVKDNQPTGSIFTATFH
jgi:signal transduction histidine kinase